VSKVRTDTGQIEGAFPSGKPMLESYQANCKFMREILA
jgi:hypothetical protein